MIYNRLILFWIVSIKFHLIVHSNSVVQNNVIILTVIAMVGGAMIAARYEPTLQIPSNHII